ncbi:MAG: hypothetical protein V7607_2603 [Solirubrobacteraceae bacterium]
MSQLINPVGPEANNQRAEEFEDQVVAFAATLGWDARCRNVDLFNTTGDQSKGVDVLLAFDDPQLGERHGIIGEAKIRHPLTGSATRSEVAVLAKKLAILGPVVHKLSIANDIVSTRIGLLVYDAAPFSPASMSEALSALQEEGLSRAQWPREVFVLGPDTLVGFGDVVGRAEPEQYFWPPFDQRPGRWSRCAPPQQVAAGMLAYRSSDGTVTLWLRDPLDHDEDFRALPMVAWEWRINVDRIVCSSVDRDRWRTIADRWRLDAERAAKREAGKVPDGIEPRALTFTSLTAFVDRWGQAA